MAAAALAIGALSVATPASAGAGVNARNNVDSGTFWVCIHIYGTAANVDKIDAYAYGSSDVYPSDSNFHGQLADPNGHTLVNFATARIDQRLGVMLGNAHLPGKKRPDVVNGLVALTAAYHDPAAGLTSDPADITAYLDTLPKARAIVVPS